MPDGHANSIRIARHTDGLSAVFQASRALFDNPQAAGAAALIGGATRIVIAGSGRARDAAGFGGAVFAEIGYDTLAIHAGDLRAGESPYRPGDLVIGIDSESNAVASALRRAHNAGLHTIGVTTHGLTILDADVLLYLPVDAHEDTHADIAETIACCLALAWLAARVDPGAAVAGDLARTEANARSMAPECGRLVASLMFAPTNVQRVIFASRGNARWATRSLARQINQHAADALMPPAIAAELEDIDEGSWTLKPTDILVSLDPYEDTHTRRTMPDRRSKPVNGPQRSWEIGRAGSAGADLIALRSRSPAICALTAFVALSSALAAAEQPALLTS